METKQFLQRVLGDEVINSANSLDEQGYDTYFGLATLKQVSPEKFQT